MNNIPGNCAICVTGRPELTGHTLVRIPDDGYPYVLAVCPLRHKLTVLAMELAIGGQREHAVLTTHEGVVQSAVVVGVNAHGEVYANDVKSMYTFQGLYDRLFWGGKPPARKVR